MTKFKHRQVAAADPHKRALLRAAILIAGTAMLGACKHTDEVTTASIPTDYRERHPITIQEAARTLEVFVGNGRGGLAPEQRAEVLAFIGKWHREGTGGITIDQPTGTPNARAAADALREIRSLLNATRVPTHGVIVRPYRPADPARFATLRLSFPRITAAAGPCGLWPEDLGPTRTSPIYITNRPYWNFGCAYQRNMAAMVANPADLVQPRSETPPYTARRSVVLEKYSRGESTSTVIPEANQAKISDVGK